MLRLSNPTNNAIDSITTEPEVDNKGLQLFADLKLSIDSLTEEMKTKRRNEQNRLASIPNSVNRPFVLPLNNNGQGIVGLGGPQPGRQWIIRELMAVHSTFQAINPTGASATGAAGAATSVQLNASTITGFDVTIGPATATGTATITLSNVSGGPYTYYLDELVGNGESFSKSGLTLAAVGIPTLSVNAVANGGIVSLNLYGIVDLNQVNITWYIGQPPSNASVTPLAPQLAIHRAFSTPDEKSYTSDVHRVFPNQQLIIGAMNGPGNGSIVGMYSIRDMPLYGERERVPV